jgi:hypothetical protein
MFIYKLKMLFSSGLSINVIGPAQSSFKVNTSAEYSVKAPSRKRSALPRKILNQTPDDRS